MGKSVTNKARLNELQQAFLRVFSSTKQFSLNLLSSGNVVLRVNQLAGADTATGTSAAVFATDGTTTLNGATVDSLNIANGSGALKLAGGNTRFESTAQTLASSGSNISVAHGGPRTPDIARAVLRRNSTSGGPLDNSYALNDEVDVTGSYDSGNTGYAIWANATNVGWNNLGLPMITYKTGTTAGGNVQVACWDVVLYCIWL